MANAKRNWSTSEPSVRKPHAAHMAKPIPHDHFSDLVVTIDWTLVEASFKSKSDPNRAQMYQPPIVGKSICR